MNPSSDENEVWRLGPLPEPVSWAVGILLVLLIVALVLQVAVELHRDWSK